MLPDPKKGAVSFGGPKCLQQSRFAEWGEVFGDPVVATALLDRLLHHAVVIQIEGSSYRMREHAALVPENVRNGAAFNPPPQKRRGRPPMKGKTDLEHG